MRDLIIAIKFLTIFPGNIKIKDAQRMARSMLYFPLVGGLIGAILALLFWGCSQILPKILSNILVLTGLAFITGGLHIEGFADMCDGFYAGKGNREHILAAMKDAHIGSMAVICLILLMLFKLFLLQNVPIRITPFSLIMMCVISRWCQVLAVSFSPYIRQVGTGRAFAEHISYKEYIGATIIALTATAILMQLIGLILILLSFIATFLLTAYFKNKLGGGITGDIVGGISELIEVLCLFLILLVSKWI